MTDFDAIIIGAGAVGLACGYALSAQGLSVVVLEAEKMIASITSARNSEVIHAGLYYPKESLKHLLCLRGRHLLYQFATEQQIAYKKCGKLIVATNEEEQGKIEALFAQAQDNGVENVCPMTVAQIAALEPQIRGKGGLISKETGIIDAHGFCQALARNIEQAGGIIALNTPFLRASPRPYGFDIFIGGKEPATLTTRLLINSAGLNATQVARRIEGLPGSLCPTMTYAKGSYFSLAGKSPFSRLVYPAPVEGGLGVHATLDLAGRVRFGPDVEWLEPLPKNALEGVDDHEPMFDYHVDVVRATGFYAAIRRYWPSLPEGALIPDYAGIRPKLSGRGQLAADFSIEDASLHKLAGLINLFGIESPGLTASLAIGEAVANRLKTL